MIKDAVKVFAYILYASCCQLSWFHRETVHDSLGLPLCNPIVPRKLVSGSRSDMGVSARAITAASFRAARP